MRSVTRSKLSTMFRWGRRYPISLASKAEQVFEAEAAAPLTKLCLEYSDISADGNMGVAATNLFEAPVDTSK